MTVKIYNLKCPNCGATLTTDVKNNHARCEYCGNDFYITEETEKPAGNESQDTVRKNPTVQMKRTSEDNHPADDSKIQKNSDGHEKLIFFLFLIIGLTLNFFLDKESPRDIVPKTDLHRFFMELQLDSTPQNVEALAQKYKLHFIRLERQSTPIQPTSAVIR